MEEILQQILKNQKAIMNALDTLLIDNKHYEFSYDIKELRQCMRETTYLIKDN